MGGRIVKQVLVYTGFPKFLYNIGFFGANRLAGGRFHSFGVAGDLIFSLAATVLEILKKPNCQNRSKYNGVLKQQNYNI